MSGENSWDALGRMAEEAKARATTTGSEPEGAAGPVALPPGALDLVEKIRVYLDQALEQPHDCLQSFAYGVETDLRRLIQDFERLHPVAEPCSRLCEGLCHLVVQNRKWFGAGVVRGIAHDSSSSRSGGGAVTPPSGQTVGEPTDGAGGVDSSPPPAPSGDGPADPALTLEVTLGARPESRKAFLDIVRDAVASKSARS